MKKIRAEIRRRVTQLEVIAINITNSHDRFHLLFNQNFPRNIHIFGRDDCHLEEDEHVNEIHRYFLASKF